MIGASHVARIVGGLAEHGLHVTNFAKPGWILDGVTSSETAAKLKAVGAGKDDILIIDPLSNSAFCGTDSHGNHINPEKTNGGWHIPGQLEV
jgi:hypothetical protein